MVFIGFVATISHPATNILLTLQDKVSPQHDTDADPKGRGVRTP